MELLFLTAGSYSDYHILGAFLGEIESLVKVRSEIEPIIKEIEDLSKKYYDRSTSENEKDKIRPILQSKRDLISYDNFVRIAAECGVIYVDQGNENTIHYDE